MVRGLKNGGKNYILRYFLESAEADIVCVAANSIRRLLYVCVDAVSTAVFSIPGILTLPGMLA
jgi:hypothetical protein